MKKVILIFLILSFNILKAQNKMGYTWIVGFNVDYAEFDGSSSAPNVGQKFNSSHPNTPMMFTSAHSNICDSNSGRIVLSTGGMLLLDSLGFIVENGDSLQPNKAYGHNCCPADGGNSQGSIILPKGNNQEYYVFIPTVTDSLYDILWTNPNGSKAPYDLLRYHIVDMKLNGGSGKVIEKNKVLLKNFELSKVMMQACKHSNGRDWWLFKHALDENTIYKFLVTKDSIYGPFIQTFAQPLWGTFDIFGQSAFSKDGKKYGAVMGKSNKLFLADFDRCSGELSNPKIFNIPIDSTTDPYWDNQGSLDSLSNGICFSANNQFVYISKRWNIYQFEFNQSDSSQAWFRVKHGFDTTKFAFEYYGQLYRAPNNRIYIGKIGGSFTQFSVIDNPDNKGIACNFCRKCFRIDTAAGGLTAPPNMPDYELGADNSVICWPLSSNEFSLNAEELIVYPNPTNSIIYINTKLKMKRELFNSIGQLILFTIEDKMDVGNLAKGVYYIKVGPITRKIVIEN
jgi:hypothetical protein